MSTYSSYLNTFSLGMAVMFVITQLAISDIEADPPPPLGITARATVDRVIDGDTIEVVVHWPLRIRMKDCWAPETRGPERPLGIKSKAHLEEIIAVGDPVVFSVDSGQADSLGDLLTFGRVVGTVWEPDAADSLSAIMVESGHATVTKQKWDVDYGE